MRHKLTIFLRKEWILFVLIVIAIIVGLCSRDKYDWETAITISYFAFISAFSASLIAVFNLQETRKSLNISIRPWVTIGELSGEISYPNPKKAEFVLAIALPMINTGTVPATAIYVESRFEVTLIGTDIEPQYTQSPALAPDSNFVINHLLKFTGDFEKYLDEGKLTLYVQIKYSGLKRKHESVQTYQIERSKASNFPPGKYGFNFIPSEPTYFT